MPRVVLVRHGHPTVEGEDHARWVLSDEGREAARILREDPIWEGIERIFTSPERKAEDTARIIGEAQGIPVGVREDLREVRRPWEAEDYEDKIRAFLKGEGPDGWETREAAETRLLRLMEDILLVDIDVGVISHALLLTFFLARVSSVRPSFWLHHSIRFAEYAVYDSDAGVLSSRDFARPRRGPDPLAAGFVYAR